LFEVVEAFSHPRSSSWLALLPPEEQEVFERRFDMDILHWGKVTAVLETGELMKGGGPASSRKSLV